MLKGFRAQGLESNLPGLKLYGTRVVGCRIKVLDNKASESLQDLRMWGWFGHPILRVQEGPVNIVPANSEQLVPSSIEDCSCGIVHEWATLI